MQQAVAEPEVRKTMDIEDEILEELQNKERFIARLIHEKETAVKQKEQEKEVALKQKDQEKETALKQKDQEKKIALKQKEQEKEQENTQALKAQEHNLVINAYRSGLDVTTIQKITQLELKTIEKIIAAQ